MRRVGITTILSWAVLVLVLALIAYGTTNKWEVIKAEPDPDGFYIPVNPPQLTEIKEYEAVKLFGGTGITHLKDAYPQQNKYTGICFA
jgi:hypothetical protein